MSSAHQNELFTPCDVSHGRLCRCKFLSGIYLKYAFCLSMSLYKSLKGMYVINLTLAVVTLISLIPIAQVKGTRVNPLVIIGIIKFMTLTLSLMVLNRVIMLQQMKRNSKLAYANSVCLLFVTLV